MGDEQAITTRNIKVELASYAQKIGVDPDNLDFTLIKYETLIKSVFYEEPKPLSKELIRRYAGKSFLIFREKASFIQEYTIKVVKKSNNNFFNLKTELIIDHLESRARLKISPKSKFNTKRYSQNELYKALYAEIIKIKAHNNILISFFSDRLLPQLKRFIINLYANKFNKEVSIIIYDGIMPKQSQKSFIEQHFINKTNEDKTLIEVEENEPLVSYTKPIYGRDGFSVHGEILEYELKEKQARLPYSIDNESILCVEDNKKAQYFARFKGYVQIVRARLFVKKRYISSGIKSTQKVFTDAETNNIEVVVAEQDMTKDGVGDGVNLVSQSVKITGAVGKNATIKAKDVIIDGLTHAQSKIYAKTVQINRHIGLVNAHKVHIKTLEGGTVYATEAIIDNVISGVISAEKIEIKNLKNNAKIYGSEYIVIDNITGEDNVIGIDVSKVETLKRKILFYKQEIEDLQDKIKETKKFPTLKNKTIALAKDIKLKRLELLESLFDPFKARISIKSHFRGLNTIYFYIYSKNFRLEFKTSQDKTYDDFRILDNPDLKLITLLPVDKDFRYD